MQLSHPFSLVTPVERQCPPGRPIGSWSQDRRHHRNGQADQWKRRVHLVPQSARAGQRPGIAEFSGQGQLQRPVVPGLPRSNPANRAARSIRWPIGPPSAHALSTDKISPHGTAGQLRNRGSRCLHLLPCAAQRQLRRRSCCAARMSRIASPATTASNVSPMATYANVFPEYAKPKVGHPFPTSTNPHDAAEATLLNNNRHATCVDCHNAHGSQAVGTAFPPPPLIRISQKARRGHQRHRRNHRAYARHQSI